MKKLVLIVSLIFTVSSCVSSRPNAAAVDNLKQAASAKQSAYVECINNRASNTALYNSEPIEIAIGAHSFCSESFALYESSLADFYIALLYNDPMKANYFAESTAKNTKQSCLEFAVEMVIEKRRLSELSHH